MIVKVKNKCETCAHENVCVKKDGMQTFEHEFDKILGSDMNILGETYYCERYGFEGAVGWTKHDDMDFCPKCSEKYDSMMKDFLSCKEN